MSRPDPLPDHFGPGERVQPTHTTWGPGAVVTLERAEGLSQRDVALAGSNPGRFVWVLHDTGGVAGWYPESLEAESATA